MPRWIRFLRLLYFFEKFLNASLSDANVSLSLLCAFHSVCFSGSRLAIGKDCTMIALKVI